jgi:DNA-binding transcriptional LysR family regulator
LDTELARTFLTVIGAGSFIGAAERLHVTQSTVSARIHALEEQLGCSLLVRNKAGTTLTPAGRRFQKHAAILVRAVERARQEVGVPSGYQAVLTVGGRFGLWEGLLLRWLEHFGEQAPDVSVGAEIGFEDDLMQGLVEGRIDIGVMYTPQSRPGLKVERLLEEQLVLVSTRAALEPGLGEAMSTSTGGRSSTPGTACSSLSLSGRGWLPASVGWACSTSWRAAAQAFSRGG